MFTTLYKNNHSSTIFSRRRSTIINAMTNDRSQFPLRTNHLLNPIPPIRESISKNSTNIKRSLTSYSRSNTNENTTLKSSKQTYTFSNPPRELQRKRSSSLRQRVSSAPDENSPRSRLNQPKSSSANGSLTPRSRDDHSIPRIYSKDQVLKHDEKQKDSLNALIKEQEKSKVPKAVQRRRIVLLFHRSSPRQEQNFSPISDKTQISSSENLIRQTNNQNSNQFSQPSDSSDNVEAEMADSMQLAAILANIQLQDDWNPNEASPKQQQQQRFLDPSKYEYVVANPSDVATYRLSPRTLKPREELAARLRFSQYYQSEMRSSANAQIPPLMASVVTENSNSIRTVLDIERTFTFKLNPTDTMKNANSFDENQSIQSTVDNELVQLCYDATLKRFYDPNNGVYYELTSE